MKTKITRSLLQLLPATAMLAGLLFTTPAKSQMRVENVTVPVYENQQGYDYHGDFMSNIVIYPTPTHSFVTMKGQVATPQTMNFIVTDILGREVYERTELVNTGLYQHQFDLSNLPNGLYLLEISNGKNSITTRMIKD